jgi:hypothetical protein
MTSGSTFVPGKSYEPTHPLRPSAWFKATIRPRSRLLTLTNKRLVRVVTLEHIPSDGRPLAVAQAIEELIRASWLELLIKPDTKVPASVTRVVTDALPREPARQPRMRQTTHPPPISEPIAKIGAALTVEGFTGGIVRVGPDLRMGVRLSDRVGLIARVGYRRGLVVTAPNGSIESDAMVAGVDAAIAVVTVPKWQLGLEGGVDIARTTFEPRPNSDSSGLTQTLTNVEASVGPYVAWRPVRWLDASVGVRVGAPLVIATALDDSSKVASTDGLMVSGSLAIDVRF